MADLYIFVYGTLKPGGRYHQRYCSNGLSSAVPAFAKGELHDFPQLGYPAVTEGDAWVSGYLLHFQGDSLQIQQILTSVDRLEGYSQHRSPSENDYQRCEKQIFDVNRLPLCLAWVYQMDAAKVSQLKGIRLPEGEWPIPT